MADVRPVSGSLPAAAPARPLPAVRAQAIAAAQKAFFDQALANGAQASSVRAPTAAATVAAAPPTPRVTRLSFDPAEPAPTRPLRPGSLLDIKV